MDIPFWLPTDNHHRSGMPVWIPAFPQPGEDVWYPPLQDDPPSHRSQWPRALPLALVSIRTAHKEDLQASAAEFVYGEPLRVPGELLIPAAPKVGAPALIQHLRRHMDQLRTTPAARHASLASFIHKDLRDSTHVFLRQDAIRRALEPPYSGPHKVITRTDKTLTIVVRGRQVTISADQVKPACIFEGTQPHTGSPPAQPHNTPTKPATPTQPPRTTCSGRIVSFPAHFVT